MSRYSIPSGGRTTQAGLIVAFSILLGIIVEAHTKYQLIEIIVGVNAVAGLVTFGRQLGEEEQTNQMEKTQKDSKQKMEVNKPEERRTKGQERPGVGPSKGLTAEEQAVQNEMIRSDYNDFRKNPVANFIFRNPMVNGVSDEWSVSDDTVRKVWKISADDGFYKKKSNSWALAPKAAERAGELGEELLLDEPIQDEILGLLLEKYREAPTRPIVERQTLVDALNCSEDELDHNVWLLEEKRFVATRGFAGDSRGYSEVKITDLGRRTTE